MKARQDWLLGSLRLILLAIIFYALVTLAMLIGSASTGAWEKAVLTLLAMVVYAAAVSVHRMRVRH